MLQAHASARVPTKRECREGTEGRESEHMISRLLRSRICDWLFSAVLLVQVIVCFYIGLGSIVWLVSVCKAGVADRLGVTESVPLFVALGSGPFVATAAGAAWLLVGILRRRTLFIQYATFIAANALILFLPGSLGFFDTPMHDLALLVGSHGRFGCQAVPPDLINEETFAAFLTIPTVLTAGLHFLLTVLRTTKCGGASSGKS